MKNKITRFLLVASFLISAISCSVDEQEPSFSNVESYLLYKPTDNWRIRQNLDGSYYNSRTRIVIILEGGSCQYFLKERGIPRPRPITRDTNYSVSFNNNTAPILTTSIGAYRIVCANNNRIFPTELHHKTTGVVYSRIQ